MEYSSEVDNDCIKMECREVASVVVADDSFVVVGIVQVQDSQGV